MRIPLYAIKRGVLGICIVFCTIIYAHPALAASLLLSSPSVNVTTGDIVTVRVAVDAGGEAINTAEGTLQFPTDILQTLSIDQTSSIFSIWVQSPSFSNDTGEVTFSGGLPTPGYSGLNGTVLTVSFLAKHAGTATFSLTNATVRANDGLGTDVLQSTGSLQLTVVNAPAPVAPPVVVPSKTPPTQPAPAVSNTSATTTAIFMTPATPTPILDLLADHMNRGDQLSINGQAPPRDTQIYVYITKDAGIPTELTTTPDPLGAFSVLGPILEDGTYQVWAEGVSAQGVLSEPTGTMSVVVGEESLLTVGSVSFTLTSLLLLVLLFSFAALVAAIVGWYKVYQYHKGRRSEVARIEKRMHRAFDVFKDGIEKHIDALDDAGSKRELTTAESKLKVEMKSNLLKLEKYIDEDLS